MRVRMLTSETGRIRPGGPKVHCRAGEEYDVDDEIGKTWTTREPIIAERVKELRKPAKDDRGD